MFPKNKANTLSGEFSLTLKFPRRERRKEEDNWKNLIENLSHLRNLCISSALIPREITIIIPVYLRGNWDQERLNNSLKITYPVNGNRRFKGRYSWFQTSYTSPQTIICVTVSLLSESDTEGAHCDRTVSLRFHNLHALKTQLLFFACFRRKRKKQLPRKHVITEKAFMCISLQSKKKFSNNISGVKL